MNVYSPLVLYFGTKELLLLGTPIALQAMQQSLNNARGEAKEPLRMIGNRGYTGTKG